MTDEQANTPDESPKDFDGTVLTATLRREEGIR